MHAVRALLFLVASAALVAACRSSPSSPPTPPSSPECQAPSDCPSGQTCALSGSESPACASEVVCQGPLGASSDVPSTWAAAVAACNVPESDDGRSLVFTPCDGFDAYWTSYTDTAFGAFYSATTGQLVAEISMGDLGAFTCNTGSVNIPAACFASAGTPCAQPPPAPLGGEDAGTDAPSSD